MKNKKGKHSKIVQKALDALGFNWNEAIQPCFDEKDIKQQLKFSEMQLVEFEDYIEAANRNIEIAKRNIENYRLILRQIEIEEYKELNPNAIDIF